MPLRLARFASSLAKAAAVGAAALVLTPAARADDTVAAAQTPELTYEEHIRPILKAHCFHCHGAEGPAKGGLDLRLRHLIEKGGDSGSALKPGSREESLVYLRPHAGEMPPTDAKLSIEEVETIGRWIDSGAATKRPEPAEPPTAVITPEERQFWAFQPVARPAVPAVKAAAEVRTPIDAFLLAELEARGLTFAAAADKLTLLKRACFDLTGLPPSADELATFLADDAPDAFDRLVDRLLASPHYGERWGRHWLDVAGYAESDGYVDEDRPRPYAYKYRDYVIRSFNADKPFSEFVVEQLAGDELIAPPYQNLSTAALEKLAATGYLRMAADGTGTAAIDENLARNQTIADTIKIVSTSLLALSVGCAQCHDHRYDPILQTDYYRMRALFEPAYDWQAWRSRQERLISLYTDADRAKAAEVEAEAGKVAAERAAKEKEFLAAALEQELEKFPAEMREPLRIAYQTPADQRGPEQVKLLADNPSVNISPGVLYQYNQSAADELKKFDARIGEIRAQKPAEDFVMALTEVPGRAPPVTRLFHRGDYQQPQAEVPPGELTVCTADGAPLDIAPQDDARPTTGRRLAYAQWLTSGQHPLVARVAVNRIWQHHFGRGLVGTPSDFGALGERPTHPALLDWLAEQLVAGGWRMKRLHKLLMTSTAYRQASLIDPAQADIDPENNLLGHMPVRRLEAEAIRDRILAASGALNPKMFGPSVAVSEDGVGQIVVPAAPQPAAPLTSRAAFVGGEESRRSVYIEVRRSRPLAMLRTFDAPVMETNCDRRPASTVAPQGLALLNSDFILAESARFARRARFESGGDRTAAIVRAWQIAYLRSPREEELKSASEFCNRQVDYLTARRAEVAAAASSATEGYEAAKQAAADEAVSKDPSLADPELQSLTNLCQVLLSSNEFLYVD
ncbi:MAG: PSD1 and planctomycete cytochrome C domain-containing protein [Pirellulales bacterium]